MPPFLWWSGCQKADIWFGRESALPCITDNIQNRDTENQILLHAKYLTDDGNENSDLLLFQKGLKCVRRAVYHSETVSETVRKSVRREVPSQ